MQSRSLLVLLAFVAFIALGLPDALLGIAWPSMRINLAQPLESMGLIVLAGTLGSALSGLFSAKLGLLLGIGKLLGVSCLLTGFALVGYTLAPNFGFIIFCSATIGLAAGATDATVNGFIAKNFSDRLMQWLHASFGIGVTVGPVVMTFVLVKRLDWSVGYQIHAGIQIVLALLFFATASLWLISLKAEHQQEAPQHEADNHATSMKESLGSLRVWLSMAMFFFYTGLEFSVGLWTFSLLTDVRGISTPQAGLWVSLYWGMFTVGRIVMGIVANRFSHNQLMAFSFILAGSGTILYALGTGPSANLIALISIGFAYAPMYPAMVSGTLKRVGAKHFNNAMGMQVTAASLGIAILPGTIGLVASQFSLTILPWLLLLITAFMLLVYLLSSRFGSTS